LPLVRYLEASLRHLDSGGAENQTLEQLAVE
jgi:hypothetical protein